MDGILMPDATAILRGEIKDVSEPSAPPGGVPYCGRGANSVLQVLQAGQIEQGTEIPPTVRPHMPGKAQPIYPHQPRCGAIARTGLLEEQGKLRLR